MMRRPWDSVGRLWFFSRMDVAQIVDQLPDGEVDFADVKRQESVKRALVSLA